jgi:hypothetical protein
VCVHGLPRAQDTRRWPLVEPLPSYGRGRELPGPRYASFIHGDGLRDVVITGELSLAFPCSARLPPLPSALSVCCLLLCAREYPVSSIYLGSGRTKRLTGTRSPSSSEKTESCTNIYLPCYCHSAYHASTPKGSQGRTGLRINYLLLDHSHSTLLSVLCLN